DFPRSFALEISIDGRNTRGVRETELAFKSLEIPIKNASKCVQTLCSYNNLHIDFYDICKKVNEYSIDHVIYMGPSGCGRGRDMTYLTWSDTKSVINKLNMLKYDNIRIELPPLITKNISYGCGWNTYRLEVLPDGNTATCVQAYYEDPDKMGLGNVFESNLEKIWTGNINISALRNINKTDMSGHCGKCEYWEGCFGSCRSWAKSWDAEKRWTAPYLRCEEFLIDKDIDDTFHVPNKEIQFLKLPWGGSEYLPGIK
ncbi:MAG: SPASM domain-containing protein, partial [Candidatus Heimdallarchaeota archaeon]|nr:SPASM domain-containing protein [Candidatus Heimdallarchaeota archaeon]